MRTIFITLAASIILATAATSCAARAGILTEANPVKPACYDQSESCLDAWYESGDATGDYGPIDSAG